MLWGIGAAEKHQNWEYFETLPTDTRKKAKSHECWLKLLCAQI